MLIIINKVRKYFISFYVLLLLFLKALGIGCNKAEMLSKSLHQKKAKCTFVHTPEKSKFLTQEDIRRDTTPSSDQQTQEPASGEVLSWEVEIDHTSTKLNQTFPLLSYTLESGLSMSLSATTSLSTSLASSPAF